MAYRKTKIITDSEISKAFEVYQTGLTLSEASKGLEISGQTLAAMFRGRGLGIRVKGKFSRRKLIADAVDDNLLVKFKAQWDRLDTTVKGTIAENYAKNRLSELGFDVWEPVAQNHRTDLIVLVGKSLLRIQVKCATYDTRRKRFRANLSRHRRSGDYRPYSHSDVDFFIIYCAGLPKLEFYVVPARIVRQPCINLLPHREKFANFSAFTWESYRNAFDLIGEKNEIKT